LECIDQLRIELQAVDVARDVCVPFCVVVRLLILIEYILLVNDIEIEIDIDQTSTCTFTITNRSRHKSKSNQIKTNQNSEHTEKHRNCGTEVHKVRKPIQLSWQHAAQNWYGHQKPLK
jgi:hypothetical protein